MDPWPPCADVVGRGPRKREKGVHGGTPLLSEKSRAVLDLHALQKRVGIAPHDFPGVMKRGGENQ
jgi:hypothetical protein